MDCSPNEGTCSLLSTCRRLCQIVFILSGLHSGLRHCHPKIRIGIAAPQKEPSGHQGMRKFGATTLIRWLLLVLLISAHSDASKSRSADEAQWQTVESTAGGPTLSFASNSPIRLTYHHTEASSTTTTYASTTKESYHYELLDEPRSQDWIRWQTNDSQLEVGSDSTSNSLHIFTLFVEYLIDPMTPLSDARWDPTTNFPNLSHSSIPDDSSPSARPQQKIRTQICQLISPDDSTSKTDSNTEWLECEIGHLPREVQLTFVLHQLRVITVATSTLLYDSFDSQNAATSPITSYQRHQVLLSPSVQVTLPVDTRKNAHENKLTDPAAIPDAATIAIDRIVNDTATRANLELFYQNTDGANWPGSGPGNWGVANVSICDWQPAILLCNTNRTLITTLILPPTPFAIDINFIFRDLTSLIRFECCRATVVSLDLSDQVNLAQLIIDSGDICPSVTASVVTPLILPSEPSALQQLQMSTYMFIVNLKQVTFPALQEFDIADSHIFNPFPLAVVVDSMPSLMTIHAQGASLESFTPDSAGRDGSVLTHYWFENLGQLHPTLITLSISGSTILDFGSNFPILCSPSLISFTFHLNQLSTSPITDDALSYLPQLQELDLSYLPNININMSIFETAANTLFIVTLTSTNVLGTLESLSQQSHLSSLFMDQTNLGGEVPQEIDAIWPVLTTISAATNQLTGSMPSFANLPNLAGIDFHSNGLSGQLPPDFLNNSLLYLCSLYLYDNSITGALPTFSSPAPQLYKIQLNHNHFNSGLSRMFVSESQVQQTFPQLVQLALQNNELAENIPPALWALSGIGIEIFLNANRLVGIIPSPAQPTVLTSLALDNNPGLMGGFPQNLTADSMSLSYTNLSGPVVVPILQNSPIFQLDIAFTRLTCPLDLSQHFNLYQLELQSAGFGGCDWTNSSHINIPWPSLRILDISNNQFRPFRFSLNVVLTHLVAVNSGMTGMRMVTDAASFNLQTLIIDHNQLIYDYQFQQILKRSFIDVLSLTNCSLGGSFEVFLANIISDQPDSTDPTLSKLVLSFNQFTGMIPRFLFDNSNFAESALPPSIQEFDVSWNPSLGGSLPSMTSGYLSLKEIDMSHTAVSGSLPESWSSLINLQRLFLSGTELECNDPKNCSLPSWLKPSTLTSPSTSIIGAHCPQLILNNSPLRQVTLEEKYYHHLLCTCDAKFFGSGSVCQSCPIGCTCEDDIIQGCFPIVTVRVDGARDVHGVGLISIPFIISCPLTVTGTTLCNPDGVSWSNFDPAEILSITTSSTSYDFAQLTLTSFCAAGHTSRLCSKCVDGYFASGRWCLECGSDIVHIFIIILNLFALIALVCFIYSQLPSSQASVIQLQQYLDRAKLPSGTFTATSSKKTPRRRAESINDMVEVARANSVSPLKLLVFHCQQLSLLLSTATSQPPILTGFLSLVSSGSTGFSLSSLVSLECLNHLWSIQHKVWMSLAVPALVGFICLFIYLYERCRTPHSSSHIDDDQLLRLGGNDDDGRLVSSSRSVHGAARSSSYHSSELSRMLQQQKSEIPRMYGVCLALLYFFLFPCAQTVLSAIACTDTRQYDGSSTGTSAVYLNLLPWVACDSQWRSTILPPAILGVIIWVIAFPIATTLLTFYLLNRIRVNSVSVHLWPLCCDLFTRFKGRYWYYDQILLVRRLLLVGCVTLIPSDSLYLPVILFSIIQLSALIQHQLQPFASIWLNRGELISLYLLLLNYITALVLHESSTGMSSHSLDVWSVTLFLLNLLFILILIGGLFLSLRIRFSRLAQYVQAFFTYPLDKSNSSIESSMDEVFNQGVNGDELNGPGHDDHDRTHSSPSSMSHSSSPLESSVARTSHSTPHTARFTHSSSAMLHSNTNDFHIEMKYTLSPQLASPLLSHEQL